VQGRQTEKKECMVRCVRQYANVQVLKRVRVSAAGNFNMPRADLMAISEREIALSSRMFSVFCKMPDATLGESFR